MDEYISREETVKKIEEKLKVDGLMSLAEEVWTNNCLKIVLRAIMAVETADVQPVNQWISVKDRLPEEMQDKSINSGWSEELRPSDSVLILTTGGSYDVAWYSYAYNDWTTDNETHTYKNWEIAFWQPLPEAPLDR